MHHRACVLCARLRLLRAVLRPMPHSLTLIKSSSAPAHPKSNTQRLRLMILMMPAVFRYEDFALPMEPTDSPYYKDNENYTVGVNYKAYKWADRTW